MGWAHCGTDSKGREIGYGIPATCDHEGCDAKIDRGLAYACGGMHGSDGGSCEGYFCSDHRTWPDLTTEEDEFFEEMYEPHSHEFCHECAEFVVQMVRDEMAAERREANLKLLVESDAPHEGGE